MGKMGNLNADGEEERNRDRGAAGWELPRESGIYGPPADLKQDLRRCEECGGAESSSLVGDKTAPRDADRYTEPRS